MFKDQVLDIFFSEMPLKIRQEGPKNVPHSGFLLFCWRSLGLSIILRAFTPVQYTLAFQPNASYPCGISQNIVTRWDWDMQLSFRIGNGICVRKLKFPNSNCDEKTGFFFKLELFRPWLFQLIEQLEGFCHIDFVDMNLNFTSSYQTLPNTSS